MSTKAYVFIDVQNDFLPGGALPYGYPARDIVPGLVELAKKALSNEDQLFFTRDTHGTDYLDTFEGKRLPILHCLKDTGGWCLPTPLVAAVDDACWNDGRAVMVYKDTFGSLNLMRTMEEKSPIGGYEEIVIAGICTSICVVSNALLLRAHFPNTPIKVVADLCGDIDEASHVAALAVMRNCQIETVNASEV